MNIQNIKKSDIEFYVINGKFEYFLVKNLIVIMFYLEENLKSDKGNWSIKKYIKYAKRHDVRVSDLINNLKTYYTVYSNRKKKLYGRFLPQKLQFASFKAILTL